MDGRLFRPVTRATILAGALVAAGSWTGPAVPFAGVRADAQVAAPAPASAGLVRQYCVTCHNQRLKTGGLALDGLDTADVPAQAEVWEKVVRKVRGNMMPPAGSP